MTALALPWFVLTTTGSAKQMGFVVASEVAAYALFGIPSGIPLARLGARRTILICDLARAPLIFLIPLLHTLGKLHLWELLAVTFCVGIFTAPYGPAQRLLMAELCDNDPALVAQANALFQGAQRLTNVLGPTVAGVLIGFLGAPNVLLIDAGTFAAAVLLILLLVTARRPRAASLDETPTKLLDGLRYLRRDALLARLSAGLVVSDGVFVAIFLGVPVLVYSHYGANAGLAGVVLASWGAGAIVGNVTAYRALRDGASGKQVAAFSMLYTLPLLLVPLAVPAYAVAVAFAMSGLGNGLMNPTIHAMWTLRPPENVRPHVLTVIFTASSLGAPIAVVGAAAAFNALGVRTVLGSAAVIQVAVAAFIGLAFLRSTPGHNKAQQLRQR